MHKSTVWKFLFILSILIGLISCGKTIVDPPPNQSAPVTLQISMADAPSAVHQIGGTLTRAGYDSITARFVIQDSMATGDFGAVAAGTWHLKVTAYSEVGEPLYQGETDINVQAGENNIVNLHLDPVSGTLTVIVTWGEQSSGEYIYMHSVDYYSYDRYLYRYNLQTNNLEQLGAGLQGVYTFYLSNIDKVGFRSPHSHTIYFMNPDGTNASEQYYVSTGLMSPVFCPATNEIFYYHFSANYGLRTLAVMSMDGTNVQDLTGGVEFGVSTPAPSTTGDSVLVNSDYSGTVNLFLYTRSSEQLIQLTDNPIRTGMGKWSYESNGAYFRARDDSSNESYVGFYDFDDNTTEVVFSSPDIYVWDYCVSPDESKIAIVGSTSNDETLPHNLYIYNRATHEVNQKTEVDFKLTFPHWYTF